VTVYNVFLDQTIAGCSYEWTLENLGNRTLANLAPHDYTLDYFTKVFDGTTPLVVFDGENVGAQLINDGDRHYELCTVASSSGSSACIRFEI
jgi:hypothetical protein